MTKYIPLLKHLDPDNGGYEIITNAMSEMEMVNTKVSDTSVLRVCLGILTGLVSWSNNQSEGIVLTNQTTDWVRCWSTLALWAEKRCWT